MPSSLPDDVRQAATEAYGTVPNALEAMIAHSDVAGAVYVAADEALMEGLLAPAEQQAVLLAASAHYDSRYDGIVHARLALDAGLSPRVVDRILGGRLPEDARLRLLVEAARQTYDDSGRLAPATVQDFASRGLSRGELYEVFALHGLKRFSCFVNHVAAPEVDAFLRPTEARLENVPERPSPPEMHRLVQN